MRDRECTIPEVCPPEVRRVDAATAPLATIAQSDGAWSAREIEHSLRSSRRYHLLVGYVEDRPVSWASVQDLPGGLARVDDVLTVEPERRRGYSRQVMRALVRYHEQQIGGTLYLYAQDPVAIRVYEAAGFSCLEEGLEFWSAWRD